MAEIVLCTTTWYLQKRNKYAWWVKIVSMKDRQFCFCVWELRGQDYLQQFGNLRRQCIPRCGLPPFAEWPKIWTTLEPQKLFNLIHCEVLHFNAFPPTVELFTSSHRVFYTCTIVVRFSPIVPADYGIICY